MPQADYGGEQPSSRKDSANEQLPDATNLNKESSRAAAHVSASDSGIDSVAEDVMEILERYFWSSDDTTGGRSTHWPGRTSFKQKAVYWIIRSQPIGLTIPAFPFKSPNRDKTLGALPDYGDMLGLRRLNQICVDIRSVYPYGGRMTIITDGAAFNDLLYISEEEVWNFALAIGDMIKSNGWEPNLTIVHPMEVLGFDSDHDFTKADFHKTIDPCRRLILDQFCASDEQIKERVKNDNDSRLTYMGFKAFCLIDMSNSPLKKKAESEKAYKKSITVLARQMMSRNEGFSKLISENLPNHIRLSIHRSSGTTKLSVCLIPQPPNFVARSPWMCCTAVSTSGTAYTAHAKDVRNTHNLITRDGKPWRYEEVTNMTLPQAIRHRNAIFQKLWDQRTEQAANIRQEQITVSIDMGDGTVVTESVQPWQSSPESFLHLLPSQLGKNALVAEVGGRLTQLKEMLGADCTVRYYDIGTPEGKKAVWGSASCCLGWACEEKLGSLVSRSLTSKSGFTLEMTTPHSRSLKKNDWAELESQVDLIATKRCSFDHLSVSKSDALDMFSYNKYITHELKDTSNDEQIGVCRCGDYVGICSEPHVTSTSIIGALRILQCSSTNFNDGAASDSLQKLDGVAFPDEDRMREHLAHLDELRSSTHVVTGRSQGLFFFDRTSPGSAFLLPAGTKVVNALRKLLLSQYRDQDFDEVQTPIIYDSSVWETSGHWEHYRQDMFQFHINSRPWAMKPMNCPGHYMIFKSSRRSRRDLPLRIAEFSALHRNEASGALHGMTRVRKLQQDDAHIFCSPEQLQSEVANILHCIKTVYGLFNLDYEVKLSTRPENHSGDSKQWDESESQLRKALEDFHGNNWSEIPGDGAFYGPKIDIVVKDILDREIQCATVQLDYQAAANFQLEYTDGNHTNRPVVIHRAVIGSFERFLGILTEHFMGKWPFWISPFQVLIVPLSPEYHSYATKIKTELRQYKIDNAHLDSSKRSFQTKIRRGQMQKYNLIFVVGREEMNGEGVNIRNRDDPNSWKRGVIVPLRDVCSELQASVKRRQLANEFEFSNE